jgi:transposase-like protein
MTKAKTGKKPERDQGDNLLDKIDFKGLSQEAVIQVPRDRKGTFKPAIVPKHQKQVPLFNDQIISRYSFGMTNRDIKRHLEPVYHVDVSPELISQVTDAGERGCDGMAESRAGKNPSWDAAWPDQCEFFKYPEAIRREIYTTNAIELLNYPLRKVTRNGSVLVNDEAIYKIKYVALRNGVKKWSMPIKDRGQPATSLGCFSASGFRSYEFYLHKTIDRIFRKTCCFPKKVCNHLKAFNMAFFYINYGFV